MTKRLGEAKLIRWKAEHLVLITAAAEKTGISVTGFIRYHCVLAARELLAGDEPPRDGPRCVSNEHPEGCRCGHE